MSDHAEALSALYNGLLQEKAARDDWRETPERERIESSVEAIDPAWLSPSAALAVVGPAPEDAARGDIAHRGPPAAARRLESPGETPVGLSSCSWSRGK